MKNWPVAILDKAISSLGIKYIKIKQIHVNKVNHIILIKMISRTLVKQISFPE